MILKTIYELKAIPVIRDFVASVAGYYGANAHERDEIKLAAEEAAEHIIENYPQGQQDYFEIFCDVDNNMLRVVLSNMGLPVNKEDIPSYKVDKPDESIDGLKFFLIKKLTDNFYFLNLGTGGWQTVLEKKILALDEQENKTDNENNSDTEVANSRESLQISLAGPDDAFEITKLAYFTYRYSYAKTVFYYPEMLSEAIRNNSVISFVGKTADGEIVIHSSYHRSPYSREIVEAGALMSNPAYRKNSGLLRIVRTQIQFSKVKENNISIVESNLVTAHTGSQRLTKANNFFPFALKLSVHERVNFVAMEDISEQRETLLYSIMTPFELQEVALNIPGPHKQFVGELFDIAGIPVSFTNEIMHPEQVNSKLVVDKKNEDKLATIFIEKAGDNLPGDLKKVTRELNAENFITFHILIPTWKPLSTGIEEQLNSAGFFFSGIMPRTPDKWLLLYSRIDSQKFDFDNVKIIGDNAEKLKEYITSCYDKILNY
ncbi:MAG: ATP-binding protein [Chlorobi bacterium]|nr:ATP-binding protein [Chlorobiota bacterium]